QARPASPMRTTAAAHFVLDRPSARVSRISRKRLTRRTRSLLMSLTCKLDAMESCLMLPARAEAETEPDVGADGSHAPTPPNGSTGSPLAVETDGVAPSGVLKINTHDQEVEVAGMRMRRREYRDAA